MSRLLRLVGVAALTAVLGGCFWPAPGQNPDRTAYNPSETALSPSNVGGLTQRWVWDAGPGRRVRSLVTSSAGVHAVSDDDCRVVTLDRTRGRLSWQGSVGYFEEIGFDGCSFTTLGDPFVAQGRLWLGRQAVFIKQPPSPLTFDRTDTLAMSLDGSTVEPWNGILLDNLRGTSAHGVGGHIVSTPLPPPFPPIPNYSFVTTVVVGELGGETRTLNIPPEPASATVARRTLGSSSLYDAGPGTLATAPGGPASGNGLRAYALAGGTPGCGSGISYDCPLWTTALDGTVATQPVIGDGGATLYAGTDAGTLYAVDAATGAVRWSAALGSAVTDSPALAGDTLFVPTAAGDLVALAAGGCGGATCSAVWTGATGAAVRHQPAVAGGVVYTASGDGSLHAFAAGGCGAATCPALWAEPTGHALSDSPIVSGGWLYVTFDGDASGAGGVLAYAT